MGVSRLMSGLAFRDLMSNDGASNGKETRTLNGNWHYRVVSRD